jgi:hypothetical protein
VAIRISVDFNTAMADPEERVYINTSVNRRLLECLRLGLPVVLYDETLEVEATVECDEQRGKWWARPEWSASRDLDYSALSVS